MVKTYFVRLAIAASVSSLAATGAYAATTWRPDKPVELTVWDVVSHA